MTTIHVVSHTHWDREWYHPSERFRQRLVPLVDELLDEPPSDPGSFLLDGQAIILEDYLDVRPERRAELAALLQGGRLEAGPWYVLADELIPGGEALVRNLLEGRRALRSLGALPPPALYCPDSFGHPAALPSIAAGFGLDLIILWRGFGGSRWPQGDVARWECSQAMAAGGAGVGGDPGGPSGSSAVRGDGQGRLSALLYHLTRDGYELGASLPPEQDRATDRWRRIRDELIPRSAAGVALLLNGADHHARQLHRDASVEALRRAAESDGHEVRSSSLAGFASHLISAAEGKPLPVVRGELRDSYGYTWALQGTFATRAAQKRANARAERALVRESEPFSALAWFSGHGSRSALVRAAWRTLLRAHPHDTLCGCSIDQVARAAAVRVEAAHSQTTGIRDDSIAKLMSHDPDAVRLVPESDWSPVVVIRNAAARTRRGVALVDIREFVKHEPVGPGSRRLTPVEVQAGRLCPAVERAGAIQSLSQESGRDRLEFFRAYPDNDLVAVHRAAVWVGDIPSLGFACLPVGSRERVRPRGSPPHRVRALRRSLENDLVVVNLRDDGAFMLEERGSGRCVEGLLALESAADKGDLYTPSIGKSTILETLKGRLVARGPLVGEIELRWEARGGVPSGHARAVRTTVDSVRASVTLHADSRLVRIRLTGDNSALDHRLRIRIATGVPDPEIWADAAFGPVRREPVVVSPGDLEMETPPPTAPLHRYVSLFDAHHGATVFSDGLAEYEADSRGNVFVTLVRSVGVLSRNDIPERPGHAGWPADTPEAQSIGPFEAEFAILLHGPRSVETIDSVERSADDFLLPLCGSTIRNAVAPPALVAGAGLEGTGLAFCAAKESESGTHLVLRCVNLADSPQAGSWHLPRPAGEAWRARLDETPEAPLAVDGTVVRFTASPREIVTILVA